MNANNFKRGRQKKKCPKCATIEETKRVKGKPDSRGTFHPTPDTSVPCCLVSGRRLQLACQERQGEREGDRGREVNKIYK